jgi:predicted PurR-regulated permease PerM
MYIPVVKRLQQLFTPNTLLSIATGVTDLLVNFVLVVVISLYLVLDGSRIRDKLASLIPPKRQRLFRFMEASLVRVLGGYIRGQLTMAAIIGVSAGLGCWLLGVHYALVIGVLAFFFELIPMVGPVLAAVPAVIISVFQPFPLVLVVIRPRTAWRFAIPRRKRGIQSL